MANPSHESLGTPADADRAVRVFVGLKMAAEIADELAQLARGLEGFPVKLIVPADIHLTLVPPWDEAAVPTAAERLRLVADRFDPFTLAFQHVGYGPQPKRPRLLWADCVASDEIVALQAALLQAYGQTNERPFRPHVTLARIRGNGAVIARKHPIDQQLALTQRIESIELFQSPPPGASGYRILDSARLCASPPSTPSGQ